MTSKAAILAALLALALAAPRAAAAGRLTIAVPSVCEAYSKDECVEHVDKCTLCHAWDRVDVCFETAIAKRLPSKLFSCDLPQTPPEPQPGPDADCQSFKDEDTCEGGSCIWCKSAAVPPACYTAEEAKRLPAAVFKCKFPSYVLEQ